jgi:hypothetical protein
MATLYDGNGNLIDSSTDGGGSAFGLKEYDIFTDNEGESRQAVLTYGGKNLYPKSYNAQRIDKVKKYKSGIMFTLGDSYTAMLNNHFNSFATKHGLIQDNRGLASSTIAGSQDKVTVGYHAFWVRLDEAITEYKVGKTINGKTYTCDDVKLITFMGGANDWTTIDESQGINRIGSGINETNKETLYGALNYIFSTLLNTFKNADVVVILQPSNPAKGVQNMYLKENVVREIAEMYSLPIADCCFNWHQHTNALDKSKYWGTDNLHLTTLGNDEVIKVLESTLNNLKFYRE